MVHLDPSRRRVIVGPREALVTHALHLRTLNWIGEGTPGDVASREVLCARPLDEAAGCSGR